MSEHYLTNKTIVQRVGFKFYISTICNSCGRTSFHTEYS